MDINIIIFDLYYNHLENISIKKAAQLLKVSSSTIHSVCKLNEVEFKKEHKQPEWCIKEFIPMYEVSLTAGELETLTKERITKFDWQNVKSYEGKNNIFLRKDVLPLEF